MKYPIAQGSQLVASYPDEIVPATHGAQSVYPVEGEDVPGTQAAQAEFPSTLFAFPAEQGRQTDSLKAPTEVEAFPFPQAMQVPPGAGLYLPAEQGSQAVESTLLLSPAAHEVHVLELAPISVLYFPPPHKSQF